MAVVVVVAAATAATAAVVVSVCMCGSFFFFPLHRFELYCCVVSCVCGFCFPFFGGSVRRILEYRAL